MPAEERTPGIVLRTRDYSESDRIVTLLTRDSGKLAGIAKGAKHSRRRFERKLEVFSHVMVYFRRRPHGDLVFITRAEADGLAPHNLDDDLGKIALGSYMVELADALTREEAEASGAYQILTAALTALARVGAGAALRQAFELRMLKWAGYELDFTRCRSCAQELGKELGDDAVGDNAVTFAPSRGGVVCRRCRDDYGASRLALSRTSAIALATLATVEIADSPRAQAGAHDARLVLARFIAGIVDRRLRSLEFLETLA